MPNIISDIILVLLWFLANSPLYLIDKFIEDLPITADPDTYLTPPQVIRQHGYIAESHTIQTSDGYLLEMHRIPYGRMGKSDEERYPVLLFHGVFCDSGIWLITEPEKSLAFRLADEGYDVWLGNTRGNTYSKAHVKYNPAQKEFWDFSADEMGVYDVPASIDYILNQTNHSQLVYIAHSLGGTLFYITSAVLPEYNEKILIQINLAPGCPNPHTTAPFFALLAPVAKPLYNLFEHHGAGSFFEHDVIDEIIDQDICSIPIIGYEFCKFIIMFGYGGDYRQFNNTLIPEMIDKALSGTSIKTFVQILQSINDGLFRKFDYGVEGNLRQYGSPEPPLYDTNNINGQIRVYYGEADPVIDPTDLKAFFYKLPNPNNTLVKVDDPLFSHFDFLVAKDINKLVYDDLIQYMHNFTDIILISSSTLDVVSSVHNEDHQAATTLYSFPETVVSIGDNGSSENITIFLPTGFN